MTWKILKKAFLDRLFPREKRETKVEEFINLRQGGMNLLDYSLKFTKVSKYAPFFIFDPKNKMSHFVTRVSDD